MIVTDIYNHRFHRIFATNENLSSIMERDDIYVWVLNFADRHTLLSKAWNVIQVLTSLKFRALVYHLIPNACSISIISDLFEDCHDKYVDCFVISEI